MRTEYIVLVIVGLLLCFAIGSAEPGIQPKNELAYCAVADWGEMKYVKPLAVRYGYMWIN